MKIQVLGLSALLPLLGWLSAAEAQTATSASDSSSSDGLTEVVITAERRHTDLQQTPIAATVLTGSDLAAMGVTAVDALQFSTPGAVIDNFGQGIDFNIRGVGKDEHNSQTTVGVVTYRDGVGTFPGYFQEEPYYDVANLEILRGPQGTFGGQNATGGAVFVTTNDPVINGGYNGYVQGQFGNYTDFGAQGAVNLPISDTLAARVAFNGESRDSFYEFTGPNGGPYDGNPGNLRMFSARLSLLWQPISSLTVLFKDDGNYLNMGAYPADPYYDTNDMYHLTANTAQQAIDRFNRSILKVEYVAPDGITFRSVTGYQRGSSVYQADLDGTATVNDTFGDFVTESLWSEELNVISPEKGPVTWIVGAYADGDVTGFPGPPGPYKFYIDTPPGTPAGEYLLAGSNPVDAHAVFGQLSFQLSPSFQLQVGGRYTESKTENHVNVIQYGLPLLDQQSATYVNTSGKVSLNWTLDPNNFLYAFVSTGFRPGGLNVPVGLGQPAPFGAEKLTDYELGWKNTSFNGHLRTQVDSFYYDYRNFQVIIGYPLYPTFGFELNDPNTTHIYGVEAQTQAVFGALAFDAGTTIMHSALGTFYATDPRIATTTGCSPETGPASASCINLTDHQQTYAPNFTFNLGAQYKFLLGGGDSLVPRVNYGHIADQWATLFENPDLGDRIAARDIINAQLAWTHQTFVATLYGTNVTNQHYVEALNSGLRFAGYPRQYGIRVFKAF
jgi:iron complex outermembrane recepter protein